MVINWPNLLTGSRIVAIPAMVGAFYIPGDFGKWATCAIFTIAAITDFFDGYLARSMSLQSQIGRMLDPIADKLLVGAAILMLVHFDRSPILPAIVILSREILVSGLREFLASEEVAVAVHALVTEHEGDLFLAGLRVLGDGGLGGWAGCAQEDFTVCGRGHGAVGRCTGFLRLAGSDKKQFLGVLSSTGRVPTDDAVFDGHRFHADIGIAGGEKALDLFRGGKCPVAVRDQNMRNPILSHPDEIIEQTRAKYIEAFERLSGKTFSWR